MKQVIRIVVAGAIGAVLIAQMSAPTLAVLATADPVLTTARDERWPAATETYLMWSQDSSGYFYNVFARLRTGGSAWKANPSRTYGWSPSAIAGTERFVYQQADAKRTISDIYFYDPETKTRTKLPSTVNSAQWEYSPTASTKYVLFSRLTSRDRLLLLYNRQTGRLKHIDSVGKKANIEGTWVGTGSAVYQICSGGSHRCTIFHWTPGGTTTVPGQAAPWTQYGGVLDEATGDLYYIRSTTWCGLFAEIRRWNVASMGDPVVIYDFDEGIDGSDLSLAPNVSVPGDQDLLFSQFDCIVGHDDVYQIDAVNQVTGEPATSVAASRSSTRIPATGWADRSSAGRSR